MTVPPKEHADLISGSMGSVSAEKEDVEVVGHGKLGRQRELRREKPYRDDQRQTGTAPTRLGSGQKKRCVPLVIVASAKFQVCQPGSSFPISVFDHHHAPSTPSIHANTKTHDSGEYSATRLFGS